MPTLPELARTIASPQGTSPRGRLERVLGAGRTLLAVAALAAIYIDPTEPSRYATLAYVLLGGYAGFSIAILLLLRLQAEFSRRTVLLIHGADILWATLICLFTEGPNSPFFLFFVFALCAAAYRWKLKETVLTAGIMVAILVTEALLLASGPLAGSVEGAYDLNRFIMRGTYLLILGFLLGYLAQEEKELRVESMASSRLLARAHMDLGLRATLQGVLDELLRIFGSRRALLPVEESGGERLFLWQAARRVEGEDLVLQMKELAPPRPATFTPPAGVAWRGRRVPRQGTTVWEVTAVDEQGRRLEPAPPIEDDFLAGYNCQSFLGAAFTFGEEFSGNVLLLNPTRGRKGGSDPQFLRQLMQNVGPAIYSVYLLRRLRARAGAMERARVARELHDGAIQSLIAAEMQVDVLRQQMAARSEPVAEELDHIQRLLRDEVQALRELMQQMKPLDVAPRKLLEFLAVSIELFRRETGVTASFVTDVEEVTLPPRTCRELARIVQEALANVRKHSKARNALVWLAHEEGVWKLVIDDDGRGFDFTGRYSHADLDRDRKGPLVIKERVRSIGGELTIESTPGRGARLEIALRPGIPRDHA